MRGVCALACVVFSVWLTASGHYIATKRSDQDVPLSTFKLTKISQELTENGYRVRLQLVGSRLPKVYRMEDMYSEPEQLPVGPDGDVEFYSNANHFDIVFLHPRGIHLLGVGLNNVISAEQILPDSQLVMQGGNEVIFERGNDADANISQRSDNSEVGRSFLHHSFFMKSNSVDNVVVLAPADILEERESESERSSLHIRVLTASGDVEGLLTIDTRLMLRCEGEEVCLVKRYFIHEDIPVYRNDHTGPFPEHFIGFRLFHGEQLLDKAYCSAHNSHPCTIQCVVYGDHPSPVGFVRVDNGADQLNPTDRISVSNDGFWAFGQLRFRNVSLGSKAEYECSSRSGPEVISHRIKLMVIHEARITQSRVSTLDDGTVEASCQAEGTPAPTLAFYFRNDTAMNDAISEAFQVVVTPSEGSTSRAVLRISDHQVANEIRDVRCEAVNVIERQTFRDNSRIHVAQELGRLMPAESRYYLENHLAEGEGDRR